MYAKVFDGEIDTRFAKLNKSNPVKKHNAFGAVFQCDIHYYTIE